MELQRLQRVVVDALEDIKAQDIKVFNTVGQSDMFDRVVVATGNSNRQTRALAWHVVQKVKEAGGSVTSVEGTDPGEWVLVDLGDIVVHLMQPTIRQYYALEEMWGTKPVRIKLAADHRPSLAPSAEDEAPAKRVTTRSGAKAAPATKTAAKKTAAKKPPAKKAPAKAARKAPGKTKKAPARPAAKAPAKRAAKAVGAKPTRKPAGKGAPAAKRKPVKAGARTALKAAKSRRSAAPKRGSASR